MNTTVSAVEMRDISPVRSRVSWGAIVAGAMFALAIYFLLSVLGVALGLSVTERVGDAQLGRGAALWAVVAMWISLFTGGCVTSRCTVGESKTEAMLYGIIVWGVVFAMLLWLTAAGVRIGFNAMLGAASTPAGRDILNQSTPDQTNSRELTREQAATELRQAAEDPAAKRAAWWAFGGLFLSMLAAVGGAVAGAGPSLILLSGLTAREQRSGLGAAPLTPAR